VVKQALVAAGVWTALTVLSLIFLNLSEYHYGVLSMGAMGLWVWVLVEALKHAGERGPRFDQGLDSEDGITIRRSPSRSRLEQMREEEDAPTIRGILERIPNAIVYAPKRSEDKGDREIGVFVASGDAQLAIDVRNTLLALKNTYVFLVSGDAGEAPGQSPGSRCRWMWGETFFNGSHWGSDSKVRIDAHLPFSHPWAYWTVVSANDPPELLWAMGIKPKKVRQAKNIRVA